MNNGTDERAMEHTEKPKVSRKRLTHDEREERLARDAAKLNRDRAAATSAAMTAAVDALTKLQALASKHSPETASNAADALKAMNG